MRVTKEQKQEEIIYPLLFSPLTMGALKIKNRVVALPVYTGFAHPDGRVSSWMIDFYARLAGSGAGMVVVANAAVSPDGVVARFNLRIDQDAFIPGLADLALAIKHNGALACLQLNHAGRFAKTERPLLPAPISGANLSFHVESLKGYMESFPFEKRFRLTGDFLRQAKTWRGVMSDQDRERVIDDYADAALRACRAGFDMVELHGANGYLLCQYLSPFTNSLSSGFGGDPSARAAFPLAVIRAMQDRLPRYFPIGFRLLLREWVPGGIDLPEAMAFAKRLEQAGIAYLSAATGTFNSIFSRGAVHEMRKTAYLRADMGSLTRQVEIPTIISGRITTPGIAENLLREGISDLIGLGRPLRCDPKWIQKAIDRGGGKINVCINCNGCLKRVILEQGFNCSRWPRQMRARTELAHKLLTRTGKTLWLIYDSEDMLIFKQSMPLLVPDAGPSCVPALMFAAMESEAFAFESAKTEFMKWVGHAFQAEGVADAPPCEVVEAPITDWEAAVHRVIFQGNYGRIFLGTAQRRSWRKRMLYQESGKVVALLGSNPNRHRILVPVDLSDASLLAMVFLKETYMNQEGLEICFAHVLTDRSGPARQDWKRLRSIAGIGPSVPLMLIRPKTNVASALVETMHSGEFGTVVMGKRGLSGLKRWLLGSVSAGVLRRLKDQTLILVD
jgi:2,4-dienoyl-CoA reductase-like NADH-dependent reductase (Old Yellow Enzyme family)/nucleotide-binding universal stress UspA family protein